MTKTVLHEFAAHVGALLILTGCSLGLLALVFLSVLLRLAPLLVLGLVFFFWCLCSGCSSTPKPAPLLPPVRYSATEYLPPCQDKARPEKTPPERSLCVIL